MNKKRQEIRRYKQGAIKASLGTLVSLNQLWITNKLFIKPSTCRYSLILGNMNTITHLFTPIPLPRIPQRLVHVLHPLDLVWREACITNTPKTSVPTAPRKDIRQVDNRNLPRIVTVIHVIRHGIQSRIARTAVLPRRTPARRGTLLRRVRDIIPGIAGRARPVLEGM